MSENEERSLHDEMIEVKIILQQVRQGLDDMRAQLSRYYMDGHRDTPMHCKQIEMLEKRMEVQERECEAAKERDRAMMTKIAMIVTGISVGGGTALNLVLKAVM